MDPERAFTLCPHLGKGMSVMVLRLWNGLHRDTHMTASLSIFRNWY